MNRFPVLPIIGFLILLFSITTSCNKDTHSNDDSNKPDTLRLVKVVYSDDANSYLYNDVGNFEYENGKIARVQYKDFTLVLTYDSNRVTKISEYYNETKELDSYKLVFYNDSSKIDSVIWYGNYPGEPDRRTYGIYFSYNPDGMPAEVVEQYYSPISGHYEGRRNQYFYEQQNISREIWRDNGGRPHETKYFYDNKPNYLHKLPPEYFFVDRGIFGVVSGNFVHFANHLFTKNNVVAWEFGGVTTHINYKEDSLGNLTEIDLAGFNKAVFTYELR